MRATGLRSPRWLALCLAVGLAALATSCRKPAPEAPPSGSTPPALQVEAKGKWLYTYADEEGRFVTVDDPQKVPASSRHLVRVVDPGRPATEGGDLTAVHAVNLDELIKQGKVTARALSREAFETVALAQLPPGESSALPGPGGGPGPGEGAAPPPGGSAPAGKAVVTLYGTSWCGACKAARSYMAARKIPFADKDVERDPAAARELAEKARRLGISADRVPILDVRGRLLIGFDKGRFEALLGEAS